MNQQEQDQEYLAYVTNAIRVCADYCPKLGHGTKKGYSLAEWEPFDKIFTPTSLKKSLTGISDSKNANGRLLANYVAKYFEDMWHHISDISTILNQDSEVHYIVGNSTFYSTLLPVEEIFKSMLQEAGFHNVEIVKLRKRNSKKELFEFDVTGKTNQPARQSTVHETRRAPRRRVPRW